MAFDLQITTDLTIKAPDVLGCTLIDTPNGLVRAERLSAGDLVMTRDHGALPLTSVVLNRRPAVDMAAPILINAGAFGDHDDITVAPGQRILVESGAAELFFGELEVLVEGNHLLGSAYVRQLPSAPMVTYVQLVCAHPELIEANGLVIESCVAADVPRVAVEGENRDREESARLVLRHHEADVLVHGIEAYA